MPSNPNKSIQRKNTSASEPSLAAIILPQCRNISFGVIARTECSRVSAALQKPNILKHNSDMTDWAQELKRDGEFESDEVLGHLVSLRQLDDEVQDTLFTGAAAEAQFTEPRVIMHVRFLETRLEAWKRESEGSECQRSKPRAVINDLDLTL